MTWLLTGKYKGNEQNNLYRQIGQLALQHTSLWNYSHLPSALENGLQQSTIWTGWQGGPVLEENTVEPNSNRFDPNNSHLLCCSGPWATHAAPTCYLVLGFCEHQCQEKKWKFETGGGYQFGHQRLDSSGLKANEKLPALPLHLLLMYLSLLITKLLSEHRANLSSGLMNVLFRI